MIRNKSRKELIELVYSLEAKNQSISKCTLDQHKMITEISDLYLNSKTNKVINFFKLPFKLKSILNKNSKYLYTYKLSKLNRMKEEQILEALDYINDFENKKVSPILYMEYIERVTGIKVCKDCGFTNNRLHNDFQRRILNIIKENYPHLKFPIKLTSGKYGSEHYSNTIPYYTYHHLVNLVTKIKSDLKAYSKRGLDIAVDELKVDLKILEDYILNRKKSSLQDSIKVETTLKFKEGGLANEIKIEEKLSEPPIKVETKVQEPKIEKPKFDINEVMKMKESKLSNVKIAEHFGVSGSYVGQQIKKFKLQVEVPTIEQPKGRLQLIKGLK